MEQLLGMPKLPPSASPKDGVNGGEMRPRCSLKSNAPARALAERRTGKIERRESNRSILRPQPIENSVSDVHQDIKRASVTVNEREGVLLW